MSVAAHIARFPEVGPWDKPRFWHLFFVKVEGRCDDVTGWFVPKLDDVFTKIEFAPRIKFFTP
jgi:hypothetical protein